ncbi:SDR family NAD(P)-dependent oxidoreductase [Siculibacillus lacustris]|uniref:SDR family NAD(P)-dependent oxidoreductase n=1 Tax=Siculibacillus lacustris TaxID=1549641 RepID=A0A4Q9VGD7_9HYPH|nr:SDR family oxidoreductase [Siculibacillus lacustris]TBW34078.1 SDR family NAD(P)-dependent oxidoreductase [Siculibacillus lacustris]
MDMTGRTILVTGGATGIGFGLVKAFHERGNRVIIAGRSRTSLAAATAALPGLVALELDIADPASIAAFAERILADHPDLDTVLHNAGMMSDESFLAGPTWLADAEATIATNLLGPLRLTAALLPHLLTRPKATILTVTSGLAFVPKLSTPTYCATKAALHSWTLCLRRQLRDTSVEVIEIAPPYVQTTLQGERQASDPRAMPLADFLAEVVALLGRVPTPPEIIVERCRPMRFAAENGKVEEIFEVLAEL